MSISEQTIEQTISRVMDEHAPHRDHCECGFELAPYGVENMNGHRISEALRYMGVEAGEQDVMRGLFAYQQHDCGCMHYKDKQYHCCKCDHSEASWRLMEQHRLRVALHAALEE